MPWLRGGTSKQHKRRRLHFALPAFYCTMDFPKYGELMQRILFASSK